LFSKESARVISSAEEARELVPQIKKSGKIGVVIQTTQLTENFKQILPIIAENSKELKIYNTICMATAQRQQAAKELAAEVELMVVVGSKSSANTKHLAEIISPIKKTILIETAEELEQHGEIINKAQKIGVTAGASTPEYVINQVNKRIGELSKW